MSRSDEIPLHEIHRRSRSTTSISRIWCRSCPTCCCRAASATRTATDEDERTMQALHDAILDALFNGGVLPEETIEQLLGDPADGDQEDARSKLEELIQQIIERMGEEGYITTPPDLEPERERRQRPRRRPGSRSAAGHVRSHRQDARLPRLPRAARSARLARQEQLRPARHARAGDRRRNDRRAQAVRVRRHAEPRRRRARC